MVGKWREGDSFPEIFLRRSTLRFGEGILSEFEQSWNEHLVACVLPLSYKVPLLLSPFCKCFPQPLKAVVRIGKDIKGNRDSVNLPSQIVYDSFILFFPQRAQGSIPLEVDYLDRQWLTSNHLVRWIATWSYWSIKDIIVYSDCKQLSRVSG